MEKSTKKEEEKLVSSVESVISESRVIGFSDSVFAFAATLLVLKIDLPTITQSEVGKQLLVALTTLWPQYLANIISFFIIGFYWLHHHAIFNQLRKFDRTLVWINILFLITLSFLPFPVDLYGDYPTEPVVLAFYSGSLAIVGFFLFLLWIYASTNYRLINNDISNKRRKFYTIKYAIAPIIFTLAIPMAFLDPMLSQFSWILVIVGNLWVSHSYKFKKADEIEKLTEH